MYIQCQVFLIKKEEKPTKNFLTVRTRPRPHNCFQRTTGEFEGVLQTPLMPCPAVCCKVSEAVCPVQWQVRMETGKLCFSVSVGVAYGTGQIVTVKGERVEISARKYYPYLDWLKAERAVSAIKQKQSATIGETPKLNCGLYWNPPHYPHSPCHGEQAGSSVTVW